jgi:hypothetical protein
MRMKKADIVRWVTSEQLRGMVLSMTGQIAGLVVVLLALMLWFRLERSTVA